MEEDHDIYASVRCQPLAALVGGPSDPGAAGRGVASRSRLDGASVAGLIETQSGDTATARCQHKDGGG